MSSPDITGNRTPNLPGWIAGPAPLAYIAIAAVGAILWWTDAYHPASLPAWAPWQFSPPWFLAATVVTWWYLHGLSMTCAAERPRSWRRVAFLAGVWLIYAVLQTRFEYMAEHMFFLMRIQHIVMHHLGPLLIALSWPGGTLLRGMPAGLRPVLRWRPLATALRVLQLPVVAPVLFVGLIAFWLIPPIHFRAMLNRPLYDVMNWSMVLDGILFWVLVLDPRGRPPARIGFATRAVLAVIVMIPQIVIGALISFSPTDLYRFYAWCGRLYPDIGPLDDQQYGGLIIWIPAAMMSVLALVLVIDAMRRHEETTTRETMDDTKAMEISASAWTGR